MALPDTFLGSNLKTFFNGNYTAGTGTFVDDKGNATNLTQATSGNRPAADTSTAPSGRLMLSCDGTNDFLTGGAINTAALPAWSGSSGYWVEFAIFKRDASHSMGTTTELLISYDDVDYLALVSGGTYRFGCYGNSVLDSSVYRWIGVHDPALGYVATFINGTGQSDTEIPNSAVRAQWVANKAIGGQLSGASPYKGLIGCIGYAHLTTMDISVVLALDAAMAEWWSTAPGGGGPVALAGSSAGVASTSAAVRVARRIGGASAAAATSALAARVARPIAASVGGVASTSLALRRARPLAATTAGVATTSAAAALARRFAGAAPGAASTTLAARVARPLSATVAGVSTAALAIRAARPLAGAAAAAASTTAGLRAARSLVASTAGQATTAATIRIARTFGGTANGVASAALALTVGGVSEVLFAGSSSGSTVTAASLAIARTLSGSADGDASSLAALVRARALSASAAGAAGTSLSFVVGRRLAATSGGAATTGAGLSVVRGFVATSAGFATATASLGDIDIPGGVGTVVPVVTISSVRTFPTFNQAVVLGSRSSILFSIKRNDRAPAFKAQLLQDGAPVDLTGTTVKFLMKLDGAMSSDQAKVSAPATIVDAQKGIVQYDPADGDTDTTGSFKAEFEVTYANGKSRTFPNEGYLSVRVVADLG